MVTLVRAAQPEKASSPTLLTELGIEILYKLEPLNAHGPIAVTEEGIIVVPHPAINSLVEVRIMALQLSRES